MNIECTHVCFCICMCVYRNMYIGIYACVCVCVYKYMMYTSIYNIKNTLPNDPLIFFIPARAFWPSERLAYARSHS